MLCQLGTSGLCPCLLRWTLVSPAWWLLLFSSFRGGRIISLHLRFGQGSPAGARGDVLCSWEGSSGWNLAAGSVSRGGQALLAGFHEELSRQSAFVNRFEKYSSQLTSVCSISDSMEGPFLLYFPLK